MDIYIYIYIYRDPKVQIFNGYRIINIKEYIKCRFNQFL